MEAVPKLPLICFELKVSPENTHFGPKFKQYITEAYREDPESYNNEIHQLEGLRSAAVRPSMDAAGLSALIRYLCQLRSVKSRFPMHKDQPAACSFSWKDLYSKVTSTVPDVRLEIICIIYNIGALQTQLGSLEPRNTAESLKAACTYYQNAAWAFQELHDEYPQPPDIDVAVEIMVVLRHICLAQAQECILEKSIQDTRKPSVVGAVATQVMTFYHKALVFLGPSTGSDNVHEVIGTKLYNHWYRYLSFKHAYIGCIVSLYQGINAEEQQKMGERVAFYQQASERLAEARKLAKYIEPTQVTQEALTFTNDVVEGKRKAAKNENEFIYHEEVPEIGLLPEMKPVCLVKAIPINFNDPEVSGPDIFSRLVPIFAHETASLYSEEKAKLLRSIVSHADTKNTELSEFMSSLQLDQLEIIDSEQKIPQEVVDRCAAMNANSDIIQSLVDSMNNLAEIISDVEHSLDEIKSLLQEETTKEKEYQKLMGPRPPSIVQTELSREYYKYQEAHTRTNESNQVLHKAMTLHIANLKLLSQPLDELQSKIPSIDCIEGLDRETMSEMRRVVGKAREMRTQRDALVHQLRTELNEDDITALFLSKHPLMTNDEIFKMEIKKHTPKVKIIEANLAAQENIINRLTSLYASYGESRRLLTDVLRKREGLINALITSYDTHEELLGKAQKGLEFYKKLAHNVNQLLTRLKGTCQVQEEERSQLLAKNSKPPTPTPSVGASSELPTPLPPGLVGGGRKLKDYLPYMQARTGRRSLTPQAQVEPVPLDVYYPESIYPSSVRPAPVGSEATDLPMQMPDGVVMPPMQGQPNPYDRYASPYAQSESDSYGSQHNYPYPATSKDFDKPENPYGYSAYTPQQFASQISDQQQIYSNPYYSATHSNGTIVTDSQGVMQYQTGGSVANVNQGNMNQTNTNQSNMNQPNVNQSHINQSNMNQPNLNQANVNQPMNQGSIPNQYGNNTALNQGSMNPNQYASEPNMNQSNVAPNQFAYDPYMSTSQPNSIPNVIPSGYNQQDLSTNFSQMQINANKSEHPTPLGDYTNTFYSVQYPQSNTPNLATYSHAPHTANTNMVSAPSDLPSLNYPYSSESSQYGQNPNTSVPYSADQQYFSTSGYANISQGYPTYTLADNSVTSTTSVANPVSATQPIGYTSETDSGYVNPALSHLDAFDKPIKSHAKGEALSSSIYTPSYQAYESNIQNVHTPQVYANPNDQSNIRNVPTPQMYGNQNDSSNIQNMQIPQSDQAATQIAQQPQIYTNPNDPNNIQGVQMPQVYSNPNDSSNTTIQTSQVYTNPSEQSYQSNSLSFPNQNYAQGYQNHPGYTYDPATGNYSYAYGSQSAVSYDQSVHANVNSQGAVKDPNWSGQVYTSGGTCDTVQSPSIETPRAQSEQPINQQIYYNSQYGYINNTNQANQVVQSSQEIPTNCGANVNLSTYMQSGQQGHDTSVTFANNQVWTPKENVPPNVEQSQQGYNQRHDSHAHDQKVPQYSSAGENSDSTNVPNVCNSGQNTQKTDHTTHTSEEVAHASTSLNQTSIDDQNTSNQVSTQYQPVPEKPEKIPETKSESSVFDLLSDIDFTVEHKPLMPEIKVPQISESAIKRPIVMPKAELIKKPPPKEEVIERPAKRDLFTDPSLLNLFTQEVKKLQKLTDSLTNVTAGGLTVLDSKWKTFQDVQNKENMIRSKTIAMQNSKGNIVTEVVPFDDSRLILKSDPDAYINASYYKQLAPWCIPLVVSKNPTENEHGIFWKAVLENKISCVVCLLSEIETQGKAYWPTAKGQSLDVSRDLKVTLEEVNCTVHWTERKLSVASGKSVVAVTHYQINVFPAKIVCSPLVLLVDKILSQTYDNRLSNQLCGAWIQCGAGAGRSALIALLTMLMCQVRAGQLDLCDMLDSGCINLMKHRSNVLEDTKYLADAYRTALFYVQGVLCSGTTAFNGEAVSLPSGASILPPVTPTQGSTTSLQKQKFSRESFEEMKQSPGLKSGDMKDPLNFLDPLWSLKKK